MLAIGAPQPSTVKDTPEGHTFCYTGDGSSRVVGLDVFSPRETLTRQGNVEITLPEGERVRVEGLEEALATPR